MRSFDSEKNEFQPHRQEQWVIPPEKNAEFVAAMEEVLGVYQRPRAPLRPLVCLDEQSKQLIKETRLPIPATPGNPERIDYEYERNGQSVHVVCSFGGVTACQSDRASHEDRLCSMDP